VPVQVQVELPGYLGAEAEHPATLESPRALAFSLGELGRYEQAERELRAVRNIQVRLLGAGNPDTLFTRSNLAGVLAHLGRYEEAEREHRTLLETCMRVFGPDHRYTLSARGNYADLLDHLGRYREAEQEHRAVMIARTRVQGPEHPGTLVMTVVVGAGPPAALDEVSGEFAHGTSWQSPPVCLPGPTTGPWILPAKCRTRPAQWLPVWNTSGGYRMPDGAQIVGEDGDSVRMQVSMPLDEHGFFGRQCPSCAQLFRVDADDYQALPDELELWCVYCGHHAEHSEFITDQQLDRAKRAVADWAMQSIGDSLNRSLGRLSTPRPRTGFVF